MVRAGNVMGAPLILARSIKETQQSLDSSQCSFRDLTLGKLARIFLPEGAVVVGETDLGSNFEVIFNERIGNRSQHCQAC